MLSLTQRELAREIRLRRRINRAAAIGLSFGILCTGFAVYLHFVDSSAGAIVSLAISTVSGALATEQATRLFMFGATGDMGWLR